jgi:hypothetical protein
MLLEILRTIYLNLKRSILKFYHAKNAEEIPLAPFEKGGIGSSPFFKGG